MFLVVNIFFKLNGFAIFILCIVSNSLYLCFKYLQIPMLSTDSPDIYLLQLTKVSLFKCAAKHP